jgi:hypothetical protein
MNVRVEQFMFGRWVKTVSHPDQQYVLDRAKTLRENRINQPFKYSPVRLIDDKNQIVWSV